MVELAWLTESSGAPEPALPEEIREIIGRNVELVTIGNCAACREPGKLAGQLGVTRAVVSEAGARYTPPVSILQRYIRHHRRSDLFGYLTGPLRVRVELLRLVGDRDALSLRRLNSNATTG